MNKVILQLWEESTSSDGVLSDGCSLHLTVDERNKYVADIYKKRTEEVPEKYDSIVGEYIEAFVIDSVYELITKEINVKLPESAFQNLLKFEELIIDNSKI